MSHRRVFTSTDRSELLDALAACRSATRAMGSAPIGGPTYVTLTALVESLDHVAATLTGSLDYLYGPQVGDHRPTR
jgi:hypothetical protein